MTARGPETGVTNVFPRLTGPSDTEERSNVAGLRTSLTTTVCAGADAVGSLLKLIEYVSDWLGIHPSTPIPLTPDLSFGSPAETTPIIGQFGPVQGGVEAGHGPLPVQSP